MILNHILLSWTAFSVAMAVDLFVSDFNYTWDEGMEKTPCTVVNEAVFNQIQGKEGNVLFNRKFYRPFLGNATIEAWIGASVSYKPDIHFSGKCVYIDDNKALKRKTFLQNILSECFMYCSNSSFLIFRTECFCKNDVKQNTNLSLSSECQSDTCVGSGTNYSCGNTLTSIKNGNLHCMCTYTSSEKSILKWGYNSSLSKQTHCVKVIIKSNEAMKYSFIPCYKWLPLLCSKPERSSFGSTPNSVTGTLLDHTLTSFSSSTEPFNEGANTLVYVGVCVGSVVLVVIMSLAVCFVCRKKKSRNKNAQNMTYRISFQMGTSDAGNEVERQIVSFDPSRYDSKLEKNKNKIANSNSLQFGNTQNAQDRNKNHAISSLAERKCRAGNSTDPSIYNLLHEPEKRPVVQVDTYDHVPNTEGGDYHTLGAATIAHPIELSEYDSMVGDVYHTLGKATNERIPVELSDYDSMRG